MNRTIFFMAVAICLFSSCIKNEDESNRGSAVNKVLLLKVDYLTNIFEGGTETTYSITPPTFTISVDFKAPGDIGYIKLLYKELNETLFDGGIIWAGLGTIKQPKTIVPSSQFDTVRTTDIIKPAAGFENIFNPGNYTYDYTPIWLAVQKLVKVREYLNANPTATVKLFLYTPSVGVGNPADADWIIFIKN
jgi:hypothetical protein